MTTPNVTTVPNGRPAWSRAAVIGDCDGSLDKEDTITEQTPYAWIYYQEYTGALGSAFTILATGATHCRKLALGRLAAAIVRGAEKINANSVPVTADDMLGEWVQILQLRITGTETKQDIRIRAAAKFSTAKGAARPQIDQVCSDLLGSYFVAVVRNQGSDLANPPPNTKWPGIAPGSSIYAISSDAWLSERSSIFVSVNGPTDIRDATFSQLVNVELFNELDRTLPAWCVPGWSVGSTTTGFLLDGYPLATPTRLDFSGL